MQDIQPSAVILSNKLTGVKSRLKSETKANQQTVSWDVSILSQKKNNSNRELFPPERSL